MLLIIETITWKPHIETAIEIALNSRESGQDVVYCNLRSGLPICEDHSVSHTIFDLPETRIGRAGSLLQQAGTTLLRPQYNQLERKHARTTARSLLSGCQTLEDVKQLGYGEFRDVGWGAISSTASVQRTSDVSLWRHRKMLRAFVESSILVYEMVRSLIDQLQPSEVLFFNGRFATTRAVMRAAESRGVPWRIHERGRDKDHFWVTDCMPHDVDRIQALMQNKWQADQEAASRTFFNSRRNRVERDWHSFTRKQDLGRLPEGLAKTEDLVTFFTSSEDELLAIGDSLVNHLYPTQLDAIRAVAAAVDSMPNTRLCIRVHPHIAHKSRSDRRKLDALNIPGAIVLGPEDPVDTYALIDRSKVVCSYGSTIGIEATYWGRPSLLFSRSYYDGLGVCETAVDASQVLAFLHAPRVFPQERTLPYGAFWELLGDPYRHYRADNLHRGKICGLYLDDSRAIRAAKMMFGPISRLLHPSY